MDFNEALSLIRDVPDFPKKGIVFKDMIPLFENHEAFQAIIDKLAGEAVARFDFNKLVCIESRGFILGAALSVKLSKPFTLVRKPGKLPGEVFKENYELEYGVDTLEVIKSSLTEKDQVLIIDDVLATGGTAEAVEKLCSKSGATISGTLCLMELSFLEGAKKLKHPFYAPLSI